MGTHHKSILGVSLHGLGVEIVVLFLVLHQPALPDEVVQLVASSIVDAVVVLIGAGGKVDFRFDDMIERLLVVAGFEARLFGVEHIVRAGSHLGNEMLRRTNAAERFDAWHNSIVKKVEVS